MSDDKKSACGYSRGEWGTKPDYDAECQTCGWRLANNKNALGVAAQHARKHKRLRSRGGLHHAHLQPRTMTRSR